MRVLTFLFLLLLVFSAHLVFATTWNVKKDGSGDFTVIQDAVNAAAEGDVIEIGPGRYEEYSTIGNWDIYVSIPEKSLTFNGAGPGVTIIGPTDPEANSNSAAGVVSLESPAYLKIENLSIENINRVGIESSAAVFELVNCTVVGCQKVIQAYDCGGFIYDCIFTSTSNGVFLFTLSDAFVIENCSFEDVNNGLLIQGSGGLFTLRNCSLVTETSFYESQNGIQMDSGVNCEIENCRIEGYAGDAISVLLGSHVSVHDCSIIQRNGFGIYLGSNSEVQFHNNILLSDKACITVAGPSQNEATTTAFHNNHIFREGDGLYVANYTGNSWPWPPEYLDMTQNYWGTQDIDEISSYIEDGNSIPTLFYYINFVPLADGPVPTEKISLEGIKALYR